MAPYGVIVGRFQVPKLHAGHTHLIDYVRERHERVLIIVGDHGENHSHKNPMPVSMRIEMLMEAYQGIQIETLADYPTDEEWSSRLDALLKGKVGMSAILYGSRDSFIPVYTGVYKTVYVEPVDSPSGTALRTEVHAGVEHGARERCEQIRKYGPEKSV